MCICTYRENVQVLDTFDESSYSLSVVSRGEACHCFPLRSMRHVTGSSASEFAEDEVLTCIEKFVRPPVHLEIIYASHQSWMFLAGCFR